MGFNRNLGNIPQVITELNGNIGIGNTNPSDKLSVSGITSSLGLTVGVNSLGTDRMLQVSGNSLPLAQLNLELLIIQQ